MDTESQEGRRRREWGGSKRLSLRQGGKNALFKVMCPNKFSRPEAEGGALSTEQAIYETNFF